MNPGALPNLVLTGFMGTGKTQVGQEVAWRLARPFVDMDTEIEARAGKTIARIFAEEGEETFRRMEAALCAELSDRTGHVIATGGGTLVDPANRAAMMRSGTVVCLTCDLDEILRRLGATENAERPLFNGADPSAKAGRLLAARRKAYTAIPWQVDTTSLSVAAVAGQVIRFGDVVSLLVRHPTGEYPIHIGNGLLAHVGGALGAAGALLGSRVAVVSNPVVARLYGARVEEFLRAAGFEPFACWMPDGEPYKTLTTVAALYDQFLAGKLDRGDTVLSLGGGVTLDVAGLAAATFLRGVRLVQVPTTLLAMVDASVGGKTGVDLAQGKNLVGAFKQPALVVIDPTVLATLPVEELRSGMVEVLKHGLIGAPDLFAALEAQIPTPRPTSSNLPSPIPNIQYPISTPQIARALCVKIQVVEEDPFEEGRRAVLNLGHTVGHALEQLSGFRLRHGEAVAIGLVAAARIGVRLGRTDPSLADRIEATLVAWGLPVRCPAYDVDALWEAMAHDKKRRGNSLRWVLPEAPGRVEIAADIPASVVKSVLQELGARSKT
jgi:shikimate kinase/3-dehydroquinate synthase